MQNEDLSFSSLKTSVIIAHNLIRDMIYDNKISLKVPEENIIDFVNLLIFDTLVAKDTKYSYLQDLSIEKTGVISIITKDKEQFLQQLSFLESYLEYRITSPIDMGRA